jgi:glycosyltransferase involved in cell wall biosynthesis
LHDYFRHQSLRPQVAMPGTFTDFEDLYRAADVVVIPSAAEGLEDTLPSAVAAAVPLVVVDSPDTRAFFAGVEGLVGWFQAGMVKGMRDALQDCLLQLVQRREAAKRLRREMLTRRPYQQTVLAFKQLIESSPSSRSSGPSPRSMP